MLPKTLWSFYLYFLRPYRIYVLWIIVASLYWAITQALLPFVLRGIIDGLSQDGIRAWMVQGASPIKGLWMLITHLQYLPILYVGLWLGMAIAFRSMDWAHLRMFPSMREEMSQALHAYLSSHSYAYFQDHFAGSLANKVSDMVTGTEAVFRVCELMMAQGLSIIASLIMLWWVHPIFAGIFLIWVVIFLSTTYFCSKNIQVDSARYSSAIALWMGQMVDALAHMSIVRIFARKTWEIDRLSSAIHHAENKQRSMQKSILRMYVLFDVSVIFLLTGMMMGLLVLYGSGSVTLGDFVFIISLSIATFFSLWNLCGQFATFSQNLGRCLQSLSLIIKPHAVVDHRDAKPLRVKDPRGASILFDQVSFDFGKGPVFEDLSFRIHPGEKVGLVGYSGAGKSTLVNLILRLFDVIEGRILIEGQEISMMKQDTLRDAMSVVHQDVSLFHRSIMENVRYGHLDASDDQVILACQKAMCHDFIMALPEGYETLVGERGVKLSGGQRQRIAIARALLRSAPLMIFDEATSALDSVTEAALQQGLQSLAQGSTAIVIAHRLATLATMDRILVLDQGKIVEEGTHQDLLAQNGHYERMWRMQSGGVLPEKKFE